MKKLLVLIIAMSLFTACNNDRTGKEKYERDKKSADSSLKMDSRITDKKEEDSKPEVSSNERKTDVNRNEGKTDNRPAPEDNKTDNSKGDWTRSEENIFMNECEATATPNVGVARANEYCHCVLQKLKKIYPSYDDVNRELMRTGASVKMQRIVDACNGE